ncbi:hypothetical protein ACHAWF_017919, partial [Thalassiosira exigua]
TTNLCCSIHSYCKTFDDSGKCIDLEYNPGYEYMCFFENYPIGSIYYGLWFGTAAGHHFPRMDNGFCNNGDLNNGVGYCLYTRMWLAEGFTNWNNDWDYYPFAETVAPLEKLCNRGYMHSLCYNPDDPFGAGDPIYWRESATERWIYGDPTHAQLNSEWNNGVLSCQGGVEDNTWPMWTQRIAQKIELCHDDLGGKGKGKPNKKQPKPGKSKSDSKASKVESKSDRKKKRNPDQKRRKPFDQSPDS